ncbi:hypothetical protein ACGF1Z_18445 [Streptomyces sp. NPDC048018]|uniref:hypothetical protein n=1 Tax=Streptomyces sp. NPDC048018 TaxID=3365499 RepID=UPI003720FBA2
MTQPFVTTPFEAAPASLFEKAPAAPFEDVDALDGAHDPHEVTVQMDAIRIGGQDGARRLQPAEAAPAPRPEPNGPVFVDESGRRSRRYRRIGTLVGIACAVYAVVIVVTLLTGNSSAPWVPVPEQEKAVPAGQDGASPSATDSASPSASPSDSPSPSAGDDRRSATPTRTPGSSSRTPVTTTAAPSRSATAPTPGRITQSPRPGPTATATATPSPSAPTGVGTPDTSASPADGAPMNLGLGRPAPTRYGNAVAPTSPENIL